MGSQSKFSYEQATFKPNDLFQFQRAGIQATLESQNHHQCVRSRALSTKQEYVRHYKADHRFDDRHLNQQSYCNYVSNYNGQYMPHSTHFRATSLQDCYSPGKSMPTQWMGNGRIHSFIPSKYPHPSPLAAGQTGFINSNEMFRQASHGSSTCTDYIDGRPPYNHPPRSQICNQRRWSSGSNRNQFKNNYNYSNGPHYPKRHRRISPLISNHGDYGPYQPRGLIMNSASVELNDSSDSGFYNSKFSIGSNRDEVTMIWVCFSEKVALKDLTERFASCGSIKNIQTQKADFPESCAFIE